MTWGLFRRYMAVAGRKVFIRAAVSKFNSCALRDRTIFWIDIIVRQRSFTWLSAMVWFIFILKLWVSFWYLIHWSLKTNFFNLIDPSFNCTFSYFVHKWILTWSFWNLTFRTVRLPSVEELLSLHGVELVPLGTSLELIDLSLVLFLSYRNQMHIIKFWQAVEWVLRSF